MTKEIKNLSTDTPVFELLSCAFNSEAGPVVAITDEFSSLKPETQVAMLEKYCDILRIYIGRIEDGIVFSEDMLSAITRRH